MVYGQWLIKHLKVFFLCCGLKIHITLLAKMINDFAFKVKCNFGFVKNA